MESICSLLHLFFFLILFRIFILSTFVFRISIQRWERQSHSLELMDSQEQQQEDIPAQRVGTRGSQLQECTLGLQEGTLGLLGGILGGTQVLWLDTLGLHRLRVGKCWRLDRRE